MILKSLSRKTPSFGQLAGYMSESGYMNSEKSDARFEIFYNCFSQNSDDIADEFFQNSQFLSKRKNGNYLYHEILSINLKNDVDRKRAKEALRELALEYVTRRAPNNMFYGALHDDHKDHIHYHLMISANAKGSEKRYWISSKQLDVIKRDIETHCLSHYPELQQQAVMTASNAEKKLSRKAAEQKRRAGRLERQEYARRLVFEAMTHTRSQEEFETKLTQKNATMYQRGNTRGIEILHPDGKLIKYRFKTIDVDEEFAVFLSNVQALQNAQKTQNEPVEKSAPKPEEKTSPKEDDMKLKDAAGIAETYKEKSRQEKQANKSDIRSEAQKAKDETIERLKKEFEKSSKQASQNHGQKPKS